MKPSHHRYAVVVAGGSGTRLWPISRKKLPKQMHTFVSDDSLIEETVARLHGLIPKENIFISTTRDYAVQIQEILPDIDTDHIIVEPVARGTTIAFSLFAQTIVARDPKAVIFTLASDHVVTEVEVFHEALTTAFTYIEAHPRQIGLIGVTPTRADTGLGYIKSDAVVQDDPLVYSVEKFVEKPSAKVARRYVESGEYYWNAAYYCFRGDVLLAAYADADPAIVTSVRQYIETGDTEAFVAAPEKSHEIEIINASKYPLVLIPARFGWSDIGNWQSLHEILTATKETDTHNLYARANEHIDIESSDSLVISNDHKLVATVGLKDIIIVSTDDVLMVMNRNNPQQIKEVIETLKARHLTDYL